VRIKAKSHKIPEGYLFQNRDLRRLIIPLIAEQFLAISVGLFDSIMVSSVGQEAISAVSLIDGVMVLIINLFAALATGGAIVAGQYLGQKREEEGRRAVEQAILVCIGLSVLVMAVVYLGRQFILTVVFGKIEPIVEENCRTYLMIVAASIPFIAAQNAGAAVYRGMGNARVPMLLSLTVNLLNLAGNALLLYGLGWGVEGAALPTLLSRMIGGIAMIILLKKPGNVLRIDRYRDIRVNLVMVKRIMRVGIPFGMEDSMFQLGKLILLSLVTTFGTVSITANAVSNSIGYFGVIGGLSVSLALSAVCAQCVGARDYEQVRFYTRKIVRYGYISNMLLNGVILLCMPLIATAYHLPQETAKLVWIMIAVQAVGAVTFWPTSFNLPNALRASNDGTFCMVVSLLSMWIFRVGCSYLFAYMGLGVVGVSIAMCIDWVARTICFVIRYRGTRWYLTDKEIVVR